MSAVDAGYKRGRAYINSHPLAGLRKITFEQYRVFGRTVAKHDYSREKAQNDFLLGWWGAGSQFITLFAPDDTELYGAEKTLQNIQAHLRSVCDDLQPLLGWRKENGTLHGWLEEVSVALGDAQVALSQTIEQLKQFDTR